MNKTNNGVLPVLAFVFAFIFPVAGTVLAVISLAKKYEKKGLSTAALIISIIWQSILAVIIVVIGSTIGLGAFFVGSLVSHEQDVIHNVDEKKLTNYYYDSPIVSARSFHREGTALVYKDIPEDQIEDLIETLDSLTIEHTSGIHNDYFYGMQQGIECTLEDGTYFTFDGERLEYHTADGSIKGRFLYLDKPFEEVMKDYL